MSFTFVRKPSHFDEIRESGLDIYRRHKFSEIIQTMTLTFRTNSPLLEKSLLMSLTLVTDASGLVKLGRYSQTDITGASVLDIHSKLHKSGEVTQTFTNR